jgi:predicted nuclease of restriction endonuclease-like (RecB) superfamily
MDLEQQFNEIAQLIHAARFRALKSVNVELINLYWQVGEYISTKVESAEWGTGVVSQLALFLRRTQPDLKGFSDKNLWRMKQFYETYQGVEKLSTLLRELPWSSHLHILSKTQTLEEKEYYLRLAAKEKYSVRELERQIGAGFYERTMLSGAKVSHKYTPIFPRSSKTPTSSTFSTFLTLTPKKKCNRRSSRT